MWGQRPGQPLPAALTLRVSIVGATATGKTALAVRYARRTGNAELISADAFCVYRGMDVGTAKPTADERQGIHWHLLDICDPAEEYTVARFQDSARAAISSIEGRGHVPVLVGGTGLYHRAVVDELKLPGRYPEVVASIEREADNPQGLGRLYERLVELDPDAAERISPSNKRRLVRALEVIIGSGKLFSSSGPGLLHYGHSEFVLVGLTMSRSELDRRIELRLEAQLAAGFVDEVAALAQRDQGLSRTARQAIGYRELLSYVADELTLAQARDAILRHTKALVRRQESWFRRDPRIVWLDATGAAVDAAFDEAIATAQKQRDLARD